MVNNGIVLIAYITKLQECGLALNEAKEDIEHLYVFPLERDIPSTRCTWIAINKAIKFLEDFPFACRKSTSDNPFLREMLIPFSNIGYVALFEVEDKKLSPSWPYCISEKRITARDLFFPILI